MPDNDAIEYLLQKIKYVKPKKKEFMQMLSWLTSSTLGKIIATFVISMLPVVELRGGIPYGVGFGLKPLVAMLAAIAGNLLPIPFILMLLDGIMEFCKKQEGILGRFANFLEQKAYKNKKTIDKYKALGLIILVAIPLPGTGAWTGALVASVLRMNRKTAFYCICAGVFIAGIVVTILSCGIKALI